MSIQRILLAAAASFVIAPAMAQGLRPIQDQAIDLGTVAGDAFYTIQPDGFHVTATFGQRDSAGTPMRFQAVLAPGQSIVFSSPNRVGEQPASVEFARDHDQLVIRRAALVN